MKKYNIILIIFLLLILPSCNFGLFNSKNIENNGGNGLSNENGNSFDQTKVVKNIRATEGLYTDKIEVNWEQMSGVGITYIIERINLNTRKKPTSAELDIINTSSEWSTKWEKIAENDICTYSDESKLEKNTYYAYRVKAKSSLTKKESYNYSKPVLGAFLTNPDDIEVSKGQYEDRINISFTQTPGSAAYELYMNTENTFTDTTKKLATISNFSDKTTANYTYYLTDTSDTNRGKNLYFCVKSISSGNNPTKTAYSDVKTGYTFVPGAPQKPEAKANTGEDPKIIKLQFNKPDNDDDVSYTILRSISGGADTILAERNKEKQEILYDENNKVYYYEDSVGTNTIYTYSIYGTNDLGPGQSTTIESYLLSPARSVKLIPDRSNNHFGYSLDITPPIKFEDNEKWVYVITSRYNDGKSETKEFEHSENLPFYEMQKSEQNQGEIRKVTVKVKNLASGKTTGEITTSDKDSAGDVPDVPSNFSGSQNLYVSDAGANKEHQDACDGYTYGPNNQYCLCIGVYPVILDWSISPDAYGYIIQKYASPLSYDDSDPRSKLNEFDDSLKINELEVTDNKYYDKAVAIGKKYSYRLYAIDKLGRHKEQYREDTGSYGAITGKQFISEFERHIGKPWEFQDEHPDYRNGGSKGSIWKLIRQAGTGSLGSASEKDGYLGGRVSYSASVSGLGGALEFTYSPGFGERKYIHIATLDEIQQQSGWSLSIGKTTQGYTSKVDMSGTGDYTPYKENNYKFYISGWYGNNEIDGRGLTTLNQKLAGVFSVLMRYNETKNGGIKEVLTESIAPQSYKIAN